MAKIWALTFLLIYIFLLTWISFVDIGKLPTLGSSFDDKIFHVLSHGLLTLLCFNYLRKISISKPILISAAIPFCYGVIIEILQGVTTTSRTADGYDILANILGMVFAILFLSIIKNVKLN